MIPAPLVFVLLAVAVVLLGAAFVITRRALAGRALARRERTFAIAELELRLCELQQRSRETALLAEMSELLHVSTSVGEALHFLPSFGRRLFPLFDGAVYVAESGGKSFAMATSWGDAPRSSTFPVEACRALRRVEPHATHDAACRHDPSTARLCMPISVGESTGVLALRSVARENLSADVEAVARAFADQVSLALTTLQLQDGLRSRAIRDSLTGLFNRRYFEETVARDVQRRTRGGAAVSVVVIDVDWFKRVNDTFGHAGGDALLRQLAQLLQTACGPDDVICRYGGEEFVLVLPNTCADAARIRAERLRTQVRLFHPQFEGQLLGDVSISAGVAASPDQGRSLDALFTAADQALYAAKNTGRNRVVTASTLQFAGRDAA